jgi:hypothetical protein
MNHRLLAALPLILLAACSSRKIPRPDPGWMAIGGTRGSLMQMDTTRIGLENDARLIWLRIDSVRISESGNPVRIPGHRRETLHRVRCASQTVDDVALSPQGGRVPGPTDILVQAANTPFKQHRYGERVFPTVCNSLGAVGSLKKSDD